MSSIMRLTLNPLLPALIFVALTGCASSVGDISPKNGWAAYQKFDHDLGQRPERPDHKHHLSEDWIAMFENADTDEELAELKGYASYPRWLSELHAHYEKASGDDRCLSVNGVAFDKTPGLAVRYVNQDGGLRASEIHYQYWENDQEFPQEAKCPDEFELLFPDA